MKLWECVEVEVGAPFGDKFGVRAAGTFVGGKGIGVVVGVAVGVVVGNAVGNADGNAVGVSVGENGDRVVLSSGGRVEGSFMGVSVWGSIESRTRGCLVGGGIRIKVGVGVGSCGMGLFVIGTALGCEVEKSAADVGLGRYITVGILVGIESDGRDEGAMEI